MYLCRPQQLYHNQLDDPLPFGIIYTEYCAACHINNKGTEVEEAVLLGQEKFDYNGRE